MTVAQTATSRGHSLVKLILPPEDATVWKLSSQTVTLCVKSLKTFWFMLLFMLGSHLWHSWCNYWGAEETETQVQWPFAPHLTQHTAFDNGTMPHQGDGF